MMMMMTTTVLPRDGGSSNNGNSGVTENPLFGGLRRDPSKPLYEVRRNTPDHDTFAYLCQTLMHPEPMPALASRTIQAAMVHNVVGSVSYGCAVDSGHIQRALPSAYVHNFTSVVIRWSNPYITMLLFSNGFAVVVGAMSPEEFLYAVHLGYKELITMGYRPTLRYFSVDNTVASGHVPFTMELVDFENENCCIKYDPQLFPGGILTIYEPHSVVLLFSSGSFMLTGLKCRDDCYTVYTHILDIAERLRATRARKTRRTSKKKTTAGGVTAIVDAEPSRSSVKRKAQAREDKKIMNRMQQEQKASARMREDGEDADENDGDGDGGGDDDDEGEGVAAAEAPIVLTKAQNREFLRRAHICTVGVRGQQRIQAIYRTVMLQFLAEIRLAAAEKQAAKERKAAERAARAAAKKAGKPLPRTKAAKAFPSTNGANVVPGALSLTQLIDPKAMKAIKDEAYDPEVMDAIDAIDDVDDLAL